MGWTTITDAIFAVGKPIMGITGLAMRDNITALANGDTGAPKIQTAAYDDASVTVSKLATAVFDGTVSVTRKVTILSFGLYTGGSYTLPNSSTWDDYEFVLCTGRFFVSGSNEYFTTTFVGRDFLDNFAVNERIYINADSANYAGLAKTSTTQFAIVAAGTNYALSQISGWLKS